MLIVVLHGLMVVAGVFVTVKHLLTLRAERARRCGGGACVARPRRRGWSGLLMPSLRAIVPRAAGLEHPR